MAVGPPAWGAALARWVPWGPRWITVDVAVVGGGASGGADRGLAVADGQALRAGLPGGADRAAGARRRGVAYGARRPEHLLNVPAGRISADPADPLHFVRWAKGRVSGVAPGAFLRRRSYGQYLRWFLENAVRRRRAGRGAGPRARGGGPDLEGAGWIPGAAAERQVPPGARSGGSG